MEILWNPIASADLVAARFYIAEHNPEAAEYVAEAILHSVNRLATFPSL